MTSSIRLSSNKSYVRTNQNARTIRHTCIVYNFSDVCDSTNGFKINHNEKVTYAIQCKFHSHLKTAIRRFITIITHKINKDKMKWSPPYKTFRQDKYQIIIPQQY